MGSAAVYAALAGPMNLWNPAWGEAGKNMFSPLAILAFGALFGFLCAQFMGLWMGQSAAWLSSPPGTGVRRAALLLHGLVIIRDIWCSYTKPGTFRRCCREAWEWLLDRVSGQRCVKTARCLEPGLVVGRAASKDTWYVTEDDLQMYKSRLEGESEALDWRSICHKELNGGLKYSAWFRVLPEKTTEYRSITIVRDVSAEEMMDFYLDDPCRTTWDGMISHYEILEQGSFSDRHQVVRWKRSFPFNFMTDREYVIARKMFRKGDKLYGVTKSTEHPLAPLDNEIVRMDVYYSMWYTRNIPCPWGTDRKACEVVLLHHEQFKIPERLARFTVCKGMWGYVKKMETSVRDFVIERRKRCDQDKPDAHAYGAGMFTNTEGEDDAVSTDERIQRARPFRTIRRAVFAGVVTTMLLAVKHKA